MRKYAIEGISGMEMSALNKGFEHKTEQRKLKMVSSNTSTCGIFTTVPTVGRLSKACLFIVGSTGRGRVCVHAHLCSRGESCETPLLKTVRFLLLNDDSGELLPT